MAYAVASLGISIAVAGTVATAVIVTKTPEPLWGLIALLIAVIPIGAKYELDKR